MVESETPVAEQATEQAQAGATEQPQVIIAPPAAGLTSEGAQVAQVLAMAAKDPVFAKQPEVAEIVAKFNEFKQNAAPAKEAPKNTPAKTAKEAEGETEPSDENEVETPKSVFFNKKKDAEIEIKSLEDFEKASKKLGFENSTDFWRAVPKLREKAQQADEWEKKATGLEDLIANAPPDLYESLQKWVAGEDYHEPFKTASLDFNKPFTKQTEAIVNYYFPNKFTAEELKSPDAVVQAAIDIAENKFDFEKTKVEERRAVIETRATERANALKSSVNISMKALEDSFPDMGAKEKSQVRTAMLAGDVNHLFFNKDGSYKPEAAEMLALAKFGKQEIQARVNGATKKAVTEKTMKEVIQKKEKPASGNATDAKVELPKQYQDQLSGWNPSSVYDSRPPKQS